MSGNNEKQAMIPVGAEILTNEVGTAPGLAIRHEGKLIVLLPGPPSEMQHVYEKQLEPFLINHFTKQGIIYSHIIRLRGIGESAVAEKLDDIIRYYNFTNQSYHCYLCPQGRNNYPHYRKMYGS